MFSFCDWHFEQAQNLWRSCELIELIKCLVQENENKRKYFKTVGVFSDNFETVFNPTPCLLLLKPKKNPYSKLSIPSPTLGCGCALTPWSLSLFPISDCALRFWTCTLMMVPFKFWQNSDLFKKKNIFLAQKLTKFRAFVDKSLKCSIEYLCKAKNKSLTVS